MTDRKYQTIDPLILETLNLNEKRIHHIFDILHGRDLRPQTDRTPRSVSQNINTSSRLPKITQDENNKSQKYKFIQSKQPVKKIRGLSTSVIQPKYQSSVNLQNIQQQPRSKRVKPNSLAYQNKRLYQLQSQKQTIQKSPRQKTERQVTTNIQTLQQQFTVSISPTQKRNKLMKDYGMISVRRNKSLQINPKDVYRLEIQQLVSRPIEIQEMEDAQKLMVRLKRRYQHLRKFDQSYYSNLNKNQFAML